MIPFCLLFLKREMNKWGWDLKLNQIFIIYIKSSAYRQMFVNEIPNESEYNENARYKDKMLCFVHEKYT